MTNEQIGAIVLTVGSAVFFVGAALGVPGVFTQRDPQVRLRMLNERLRAWQLAQPLYGLGPVLTAAGVALLAAGADGTSRVALAASCAALAVGRGRGGGPSTCAAPGSPTSPSGRCRVDRSRPTS